MKQSGYLKRQADVQDRLLKIGAEVGQQQVKQVQDTAKALSDFLDGCDKIEPAYQQQATAEFCAVIAAYFNKHNRG